MKFNNPLNLFAKQKKQFEEPTINEIILYCDNPQCDSPIKDMQVAYDDEKREIYHVGGCFALANDDKGFSFGYSEFSNLGHIRTDEAVKLFIKGELKQSQRLEEKVSGYKN